MENNENIYHAYCLKCKKRLRKWLYEKVKEPISIRDGHPENLVKRLKINHNLDEVLANW